MGQEWGWIYIWSAYTPRADLAVSILMGPQVVKSTGEMGLEARALGSFLGGINYRDDPSGLEPDEALEAWNIVIGDRSKIRTRSGYSNMTTLASYADNIRSFTIGGNDRIMVSVEGDIYWFNAGFGPNLLFSGTLGAIWDFELAEDSSNNPIIWCMNGVDPPQKWDGSAAATSAWAGSPPNGTMCKLWKNTMVVAGITATPQRFHFSAVENPESFGANDWRDVEGSDDDIAPLTEMNIFGDELIIFKENSIWSVFDPVDFEFRRVGEPGCPSRFQSTVSGGRLWFYSRVGQGMYSLGPDDLPRLETAQLGDTFKGLFNQNSPDPVWPNSYPNFRVFSFDDEKVYLACTSYNTGYTGSGGNDRLWEGNHKLEFRRSNGERSIPWVKHTLSVACACLSTALTRQLPFGNDEGQPKPLLGLSISSGLPYVVVWAGENTDNNSPFEASYLPAWRQFIGIEEFERIRRVNVIMEDGPITAELLQDFDDVNPTFSATLDAAATPTMRRFRPDRRGRFHTIKFSGQSPWKVHDVEAKIRGGKEQT